MIEQLPALRQIAIVTNYLGHICQSTYCRQYAVNFRAELTGRECIRLFRAVGWCPEGKMTRIEPQNVYGK